ncbi:PaaX family transcriptional regulator [Streptomyces chiangmaiensis]|uniref:PaaX family transcriptional regulator C-terminal domain-containing protein n=1 Tax=Streptomyces chiangmaiensis TaxID=766497 RepID=A0ABU7FMB7_9ACTN|nr:PaaX family transcriptional regulator C-terminal domain-containing protein [Streptomyces chiangmaiensis]MED7825276.1 PaaX family transcriptional regulator C-terminal domain-containing protein [Streptomyces chiangmaiensis]
MTSASAATELSGEDTLALTEQGTTSVSPRTFIVTLYGLYGRRHDGWLSVASLIALLGDLGVDEQAVRSSISRLKRRGILEARRQGGLAGYELSPEAREILHEGDERIFRQERPSLADGWVLAVFSVPESERSKRYQLRSRLSGMGFGTVAPGVWIAPAHLYESTSAMLRRLDLTAYVDLLRSEYLAFAAVPEKVRQWWDLDELALRYEAFIAAQEPVLERWQKHPSADDVAAFVDYIRALTSWRRLPYMEPGLPAEVLPERWAGLHAAPLFFALKTELEGRAQAHVARTLGP